MTPAANVRHFLIVYDAASGDVEVDDLGRDLSAAMQRYRAVDRAELERGMPRREVVLLNADSIETLKRTHSHYFNRKPFDRAFGYAAAKQ
jgi:hypothetical protein